MHLTPKEQERLLIFTAAEMARRRKAKGIRLNYPEAVAYISDEIQEKAREGRALVAELIQYGAGLLTVDDVMEGVGALLTELQVEALFPDGTKLVTVHHPIR
ncbi:MAG TPA: urease subunit gamma [Methylomirabilota bacterium]|nr:urease subunit gamma [Methylomirabilota bacterium]